MTAAYEIIRRTRRGRLYVGPGRDIRYTGTCTCRALLDDAVADAIAGNMLRNGECTILVTVPDLDAAERLCVRPVEEIRVRIPV